ncbi:MAG: HAD-IIB family hydrolase [Gammaproteobacteria bacterium]|jgi:mannosyl-3-phosphoglycerate phosphatase
MPALKPLPTLDPNPPPLLVVTDLDGTLLDHFTYSFDAARDALDSLRTLGIPLIPNTSKTGAELHQLRRELGSKDPFIVENGSAIFLPRDSFPLPPEGSVRNQDYYLVELGLSLETILERLAPLQARFKFRGFHDLSDSELEELTGLDQARLALSRQRQFSEPLIWEDTEAACETFKAQLRASGLQTLQGGRFLHVLGQTDKGKALDRLRALYQQTYAKSFTVIALGDSGNDVAMLEAADLPVLIRSPAHNLPQLSSDKPVTISSKSGPAGWNECVLNLVQQFNQNRE